MPGVRNGGGYKHNAVIAGDSNWGKRLALRDKKSDGAKAVSATNAVSPDDTSSPQRKVARLSKEASGDSNDNAEGIAHTCHQKSPSKLPSIITGILQPLHQRLSALNKKKMNMCHALIMVY